MQVVIALAQSHGLHGDTVSGHEPSLAEWEANVRRGGEQQLAREAWVRTPEGQATMHRVRPDLYLPPPWPASPAVTHQQPEPNANRT